MQTARWIIASSIGKNAPHPESFFRRVPRARRTAQYNTAPARVRRFKARSQRPGSSSGTPLSAAGCVDKARKQDPKTRPVKTGPDANRVRGRWPRARLSPSWAGAGSCGGETAPAGVGCGAFTRPHGRSRRTGDRPLSLQTQVQRTGFQLLAVHLRLKGEPSRGRLVEATARRTRVVLHEVPARVAVWNSSK